jgi:intermediate peptidase
VQTIQTVDDMSDRLCQTVDLAELCRNVHPSEEWVEAAEGVFNHLSGFMEHLNSNVEVYRAITNVHEDVALMKGLTAEQVRVVEQLKVEMELRGIGLSADGRAREVELEQQIRELSSRFSRVVGMAGDTVEVAVDACPLMAADLRNLSVSIQKRLKVSRNSILGSTNKLVVVTDADVVNSVLKFCRSETLRKAVYVGAYRKSNKVSSNLPILDCLLECRHQLATLVGFRSFAHYSIHQFMAESPESVASFLDELAASLRPHVARELEAVRVAKAKDAVDPSAPVVVEPWDVAHYMGVLKGQAHQVGDLQEYLSVPNVLKGLDLVVSSLYGVKLVEVPLGPDEGWAKAPQDLIKLEVVDRASGLRIGTCYLDLWRRPAKIGGAATFTLRSGRRVLDGSYQTPKCVVSCDFGRAATGSSESLSHSELETLFHEMGHAMHQILSRTEHQHLAGSRGPELDFVEIPSTLMEHYAWDPRVLRQFAVHHRTGKPIPTEILERLQRSKQTFAAFETMTTVVHATLDQRLHGPQPLPTSTSDLFLDIQRHYGVPCVPDTHWHSQFSHLSQYAAGYYSYLHSRMYSAHIWHKFFRDDPLSPAAGNAYRRAVLEPGGGRDPRVMLQELLGGEPSVDYLVQNIVGSNDGC